MPSYAAQLKDEIKKSPGFFTPWSSKSEPLKTGAVILLGAPGGALLTVFGLIGTAGCGLNTVANVTTCGNVEKPATKTAACFTLALLGVFIAAAAPVCGTISLVTRTGATIAHKMNSNHHSTTPQDATVTEVKVPASNVNEDSNYQESPEEENHARSTSL